MLSNKDLSWNDQKRFWDKVDVFGPEQCWLWKGSKDPCGYGRFKLLNKLQGAHRVSAVLGGLTLGHGLCVCHICDTPACCNSSHLFLGTHQENIADMNLKRRGASVIGELNPRARLTNENVREILSLKNKIIKPSEIALKFNINVQQIHKIFNGKAWRSVSKIEASYHAQDIKHDLAAFEDS